MGTGKNLPYVMRRSKFLRLIFAEKMLKKVKDKVRKSKAIIDLVQMDAESLGIPDGIFDASVATYVLCSAENQLRGLHEIRRVLKKDGIAVFLEHKRNENDLAGKGMDLF
jgi:ubiquinone/menaquinone biosynthesis C-methylase UbiE